MAKLSVQEIKAVAEAAITARYAANDAKKASDAAPSDESLKTAYQTAEQAATDAKTKADALSQESESTLSAEQIAKKKRKIAIIQSELRGAGAISDDEDDDDEDDSAVDPSKPVTFGDLERIKARDASQTAKQMAAAIVDPIAKQAVQQALPRVVPSGDPEKDFRDAVAIANREKNSKVLEELGRRTVAPSHRSGAGAGPKQEDGVFEPTAEEQGFMRPPFNMTKEAIIKARGQSS